MSGLILVLDVLHINELDELFQILNYIKGFKDLNHIGATQQ